MNRITGVFAVLVMVIMLVAPLSSISQAQQPEINVKDYRTTQLQLLGGFAESRQNALDPMSVFVLDAVINSGDPLYLAPLLDLAFFARFEQARIDQGIFDGLRMLSGQDFGNDWQAYFEWASRENIALPPSYDEFKGAFFATFVDPEFIRFWRAGVQDTAQVNLLEAIWGGVRVDGIPSLVNAAQVSPEDALAEGLTDPDFCHEGDCSYPANDEYVFGVSINGDNRAYPLRILNWHEMFNDVIGMAPFYSEPDASTEPACNFRAPTPFAALARSGDEWVQIQGVSAACPENGWLEAAAIDWGEQTWESISASLPDVANDEAPLTPDAGVTGSVIGKPVMLAYCTLCGSGVLYDVTIPDLVINGENQGETVLEFGSTGMLMRSNKVMYDRNTNTAWNAMTGTPAFGVLADSGIALERLPVVVTDWATWLEEHPDTSVLSLDTGYSRPYANGAAYTDYFNDPNFLMFPVWQQNTEEQENKDVVFTLHIENTPKAYPLDTLPPNGVTNDTIGNTSILIVSRETPTRDFLEPGGAAVRAYERGEHTFAATDTRNEITDENGAIWKVTEDALISPDGGESLKRLGGNLAFWFGWYGYYPDTLVYEG